MEANNIFKTSSNQGLGKCIRPKGGRRGIFWCSFIFPMMPSGGWAQGEIFVKRNEQL